MNGHDEFQRWYNDKNLDPEMKLELDGFVSDDAVIQERFGRVLSFGTGGIRGEMGAGTARFNTYLVRKVTTGLCRYLLDNKRDKASVTLAIAYDTRKNSDRYAREAAAVAAYLGVGVWLFPQPVPTPLLSYAVRELKASAGIVITASHNPPKDNGYKVYGPEGVQITDRMALAVTERISEVADELAVPVMDLEEAERNGLLQWVDDALENAYMKRLTEISFRYHWWRKGSLPVRIVYTPLHGTGAHFIPRALQVNGIDDLFPVPEQMVQDPDCPTVAYPNPEEWSVYEMAIALGLKVDADLLMATDLDADRLGTAVKNEAGGYTPLSGNQLGCLMLEYILSQNKKIGTSPPNGIVVQTVVTTGMGKAIAAHYGVEVIETLTGFKYIGEVINERVDHHISTFLFGYEESYGFLIGDFVRDKDAMQAALLTAEIAAYYKMQGLTLLQALEELYAQYGYFQEKLITIELNSSDRNQVEVTMERFRQETWDYLAGNRVLSVYDYLTQIQKNTMSDDTCAILLPVSNSLKIVMDNDAWFCIRPSGTEPKLKLYMGVKGDNQQDAEQRLDELEAGIRGLLRSEAAD